MEFILNGAILIVVLSENALIFYRLKQRNEILSPYTFFCIMISVEMTGPLLYYLAFNGEAYRKFADSALYSYAGIAMFMYFVMIIQLYSSKKKKFRHISFKKNGNEKYYFYIYTIFICVIIAYWLIRYREQLLLVRILQGNTESLVRSDISGAIPHWYTISGLLWLVLPTFYFFVIKNISSKNIQFALFLLLGILTMIDGNRGVFVYLLLFMFLYVYHLRINRYLFVSGFSAFAFYFIFKDANLSQLKIVFASAIRRFFVTQGACFINRIEMVNQGYNFSDSERISKDVFVHVYNRADGTAPTMFFGDIFVKYGYLTTLVCIVVTNGIMLRVSMAICRYYKNDLFVYWTFAIISYILCMSELSFSHAARIVLSICNCFVYLATIKQKNCIKKRYIKICYKEMESYGGIDGTE